MQFKSTTSTKNHPESGRMISDIIDDFLKNWAQERVSLGDIVETLGARSFGLILLMLALPNLFPIFIPGLAPLTGAPMVLITYQMLKRRETVWLPEVILKRSIATDDFRKAMSFSLPKLRYIEAILRPRFLAVTDAAYERMLGVFLVIFAATVMFPFPFTNLVPSLGICVMSLGILQRDGVGIILGIITGIIGVILAFILSAGAVGAIWQGFLWIFGS